MIISSSGSNMNNWPKYTELEQFYGKFKLGADGYPTEAWKKEFLTKIEPPYPMFLAWDTAKQVRTIRCHKLVAGSLSRILQNIADKFYGRYTESRVNLFGGVYEFRRVSGSAKLSLHAYGAGIDFDPERNGRGIPYDGGINMISPVVADIFKAEGWKWGGDFTNPDCMHFEATS